MCTSALSAFVAVIAAGVDATAPPLIVTDEGGVRFVFPLLSLRAEMLIRSSLLVPETVCDHVQVVPPAVVVEDVLSAATAANATPLRLPTEIAASTMPASAADAAARTATRAK
jgi:hypothetical protein